MINETIMLLAPVEYYMKHGLTKYVENYLSTTVHTETYFYKPLQQIFSRVILYDYPRRLTEIGVRGINEEIIALVRKEHPKYVIWLAAHYEFQELTFDSIRREGSIVGGWFFDDDYRFDDYSKWWIPHLDYCVTFAVRAVAKYQAVGARVVLAAPIMGGTPAKRDWSNIEAKYDASFVGTRVPDREQSINELKKRNIPVALFGCGWGGKGLEGFIPFEEVIDTFKSSRINLNFSKGVRNSMPLNGKIFEVCLAGGFLLTEYVPGIENYFEIDKEIVCFKNAEEMIAKVIYYLKHDEERRAVAQAGWKRATQEYTSFHILSRVFSEIEEDIAKKGKEKAPPPQELKMPRQIRKRASAYYSDWVKAFALENHRGLWQDAFVLSISYYPFNRRAWLYYILGLFPFRLRLGAYKFVRSALTALIRWHSPRRNLRDKR